MSKKHFGSGKNYINFNPRLKTITREQFENLRSNDGKITPLTTQQIERVKAMWPKIMKVDQRLFEEFLDGFSKEGHPEREIKVFEWIATRLSSNPTIQEYVNLIQLSFEQCPIVVKMDKS